MPRDSIQVGTTWQYVNKESDRIGLVTIVKYHLCNMVSALQGIRRMSHILAPKMSSLTAKMTSYHIVSRVSMDSLLMLAQPIRIM